MKKKKSNGNTAERTYGFRPEKGSIDELKKLAKRQRRTVNWLIRDAIGQYLARSGVKISA